MISFKDFWNIAPAVAVRSLTPFSVRAREGLDLHLHFDMPKEGDGWVRIYGFVPRSDSYHSKERGAFNLFLYYTNHHLTGGSFWREDFHLKTQDAIKIVFGNWKRR